MKGKLLVVDDEAEIRSSLASYFEMRGFEVDVAESGVAALNVLAAKRIDVVISDIVMPHMDGVELLREVRRQYPMTHVIMMTGYVTLENALACMRHGADTCIFKPIEDLAELKGAVESALASLASWHDKLKQLLAMKTDTQGGCDV